MEELCYSLGVLALAPLWILSLSTLAVAVMLAKGMTGAALFKTKVTKCRTEDETRLQLQNRASSMPPPRHVAVIMDGNRRYGRAKYGDPIRGHADGGTTLGHFAKWCSEEGVQMLTAYAFSTENWNRDESEVNALMEILWRYCRDFMEEAKERDVKIKVLVSTYEKLPERLLQAINDVQRATENCKGLNINLCLSYGGRHEIVSACQQVAQAVADGTLNPAAIDDAEFRKHLLTGSAPDPDILIRTSGETRISNFLLYQLAYTEMFFLQKHWPELQRRDFEGVIAEYHQRQRRYGR